MIAGDILAVVLGSDLPILLRPFSNVEDSIRYQAIGPGYVSDLMDTEALLGPIPRNYQVQYKIDSSSNWLMAFINQDSGTVTFDDPRSGSLPGGWEFDRQYETDERAKRYFRNTKTGKFTWADPRLTVEELRKRGVDVQEIILA
jgi:hypothetical protein